ncbi:MULTISPECIES: anti-sigma F factor antagonist [Clostridium]|uniref:Anti-sigma F factor antagonist n=1 Tax=Clostridium cadaveris TaxID=1529 RepID=A0A1I2JIN4_9CLOT|nr:anti-sigma F factor antagonist [Clostridium cadaveris]MDU4951281.1 anti-sigma F factor antagonist [Clostridium sp.]MDM8310724.1 anti-sigma F factor antagonist [Clostridium cadaveris]MDY4949496.1 anti-sigma F factor antagonist [Clostridium cadaveris]NME63875.1 anti-sigma F factor antagonist [Clostridium cadaveris]NWK10482.1 anti-sigma F factor antagonist [Clostridium cadaveris]
MYLKFDEQDKTLIVTLLGELDHHSSEEVRNKIDYRLDNDDITKLILNFSGVTFMDSSGIGVVIGRYKKLAMKNGSLFVVSVSNRVKKIFELSGMYKIIKEFDTIEEALKN